MIHCPVLLSPVMDLLKDQPSAKHLLDATFGRGGHSKAFLDIFPEGKVTALDRDPEAVAYAQQEMDCYGDRFTMIHEQFSHIALLFPQPTFSAILLDLGVSSPQLDSGERGFSFQKEGPLDMRMDDQGPTAADLLRTLSEKELADLLFVYGEERASRRIAKAIVQQRHREPLETTQQLAKLIESILPRKGKKHPATRSFQALRIVVNNEMEELTQALPAALNALTPGGILIVIAFHSLEDRIVKNFFATHKPAFQTFSKKPLGPEQEEIFSNPRARSARLRFGVRSI
jgi:16S rRNA (cytosine1402-N4)-methyltransferase